MRSRYCAYVKLDSGYLQRTWHSVSRPARLHLDPRLQWLGLDVVRTERGAMLDQVGTVEFRARYTESVPGQVGVTPRPRVVHEVSEFVRVEGRWVYTGEAITGRAL